MNWTGNGYKPVDNPDRVEAFVRFRDALTQHFIPEGTLVKAFNTAWVGGLAAGRQEKAQ